MREIKFRIRNFFSGEWYYYNVLSFESVDNSGGLCWDGESIGLFTGLLDKQGKEIYEGDILRITCGCGYQDNLPVEWRDGHNGYFARAKYQHDWDNNQLELRWTEKDTEVIGNIYENKELLEAEDK